MTTARGSKSNSRQDAAGEPWFDTSLYLAAWLPTALIACHVQYTLLSINGGGYEFVAQLLGLGSVDELTLLQRLQLFRGDITTMGVACPIVLLGALRLMRPPQRAVFMGVITTCVSVLLFIQLKCFWEVGTFLPLSVLAAGLAAGAGRDYVEHYVELSSFGRLGLAVAGSWLLALAAAYADGRGWLQRGRLPSQRVAVAGAGSIAVLTAVSWLPGLPENPFRSSAFTTALTTAFGMGQATDFSAEFEDLGPRSLMDRYQEMVHAPIPNAHSRYWSKAQDYDVLVMVLETGPASCIDLTSEPRHFPNMARLRKRSFIAFRHYSTYPYTSRALFSIYSSLYPSNYSKDCIRILDRKYPELIAPGFVRSANGAGYSTAVFIPGPVDNWEHDRLRYQALGFDRQVFPPKATIAGLAAAQAEATPGSGLARREVRDRATLALLKADLIAAIRSGERYVFAFHPQYSHGPWPRIGEDRGVEFSEAACRNVFAVLDSWLGELVALLEREDRLEKTLIVLTADHGIRTAQEHPGFKGGTLDQITFQVPLMLFAPGVIESTQEIGWATSHIDIAPSVLDLLGIEGERALEQGSPIWNDRLQRRTTFFFARNYLGADGFLAEGNLAMLKHAVNLAYRAAWNGSLLFSPTDVVTGDPVVTGEVKAKILRMTAFQARLAEMMIPDNYRLLFENE